ncbi:MAG: hypothetical protein J6T35_04470 [Bacteroidales bacterium]|nr:hypothetical protein [Bacteroidales bacterium]
MPYTVEELRKRVSERRGGETIDRARLHQSRIQFHTVKRVTTYGTLPYFGLPVSQFLAMVDNVLPHDKAVVFKTLFRFPLKTNEITDVCFDKLSRIFDGRNPSYNYQFSDTSFREDWDAYRQEKLDEPEVWATKGWEFFKSEINSVLVVDLPEEQSGEWPEPYFYWLPITDVIAFKADPESGVMKYIAFRRKDRIVVLDDGYYRVWRDKNHSGQLTGEPEVEVPHDLGYTPARFFWNVPLSLKDPDLKASPLSGVLESLDWFEFFHISKRQLDLYGAYPILSGYEIACDYSNAESGDHCDGGFLKDRQGHYRLDPAGLNGLMMCPKCGKKRVVGAGSFIEIPIPNADEQVPDLKDPVKMLTVDRNALDYNVNEQKRLREEIITAVVGQDEIVTDRDAFNEQQVRANFESVTTVLNRVKKGFEAAMEWVDTTVCKLRYGRYFVSASVNLGTEFYLSTPDELRERYKTAKESGAPEADLDMMLQQIVETEYRNNPTQMRRMLILGDLEPYRHLTRQEAIDLAGQGIISASDLRIKLNFPAYVRRFERENTNVLTFGEAIDYDKKINAIRAEFIRYAEEEASTINQTNQV